MARRTKLARQGVRSPRLSAPRPRLGVSACLLGQRVRWDGGEKRARGLVAAWAGKVEWVPVCPEVELGLGVPRPPLHLVRAAPAPRLVVTATGEDLTAPMRAWARERLRALAAAGLDGYVLKSGSPSCGLRGVPIARAARPGRQREDGRAAVRSGRGLFAAALRATLPGLPVAEETALAGAPARARFLARACRGARERWRNFSGARGWLPARREHRAR